MRRIPAPGLAILSLLLLLPIVGCFGQGSNNLLDRAAVRAVLAKAISCQGLRQLHAAVVQPGQTPITFQLELLPNGSVVDVGRRVLLPLASVSKAMFATVLPLVEQQLRKDKGDPNFDLMTTPIKQLLGDKDFWFLDHVRTDSVTIEDLTSHTTGLTRHDALSIYSGIKSKEELARRTSRFNATGTFRGSFIYNNLVWTTADLVVERLTGKNFSTYMRQFLWQPLGMSNTAGSSEMDSQGLMKLSSRLPIFEHTSPFERTELDRSLDVVEAAGGIYSPLDDMVKYMQYYVSFNYTNLPPTFKSANAFTTASRPREASLLNESVTNLPDMDSESYGYGWQRSWYRDNLQYEHSGAVFDATCHLRVLPKRRLSVFAHTGLGPTGSTYQSAYSHIVSHYLTDLLLQNSSFVTLDNVCSLFQRGSDGEPVAVPKRTLAQADLDICTGSFGNYGFGTLSVSMNSTSGLLNIAYGIGVLEMVPVQLPQSSAGEFSFFLSILRPSGFPVAPAIVGFNDSHVMLSSASVHRGQERWQVLTPLFAQIRQLPGTSRVVLVTPALDAAAVLEKGLKPESWQRPELCPEGKAVSRVGTAGVFWTLAVAVLVMSGLRSAV